MARSRRRARGLLVLGVAGSVLPLVLACNGLIGLSEYERAECSGGKICVDAATPDVAAEPPRDSGAPPPVEPSGTRPVEWAHFVMPNYDAGADATDNLPTYTRSSDDAGVHDSVSKLTWREPAIAAKTFGEAEGACAGLPGGKWRLPSRIELVTLLDLGRSGPKIDPTAFPSTAAAEYWTASVVRSLSGPPDTARTYWTVDFKGGGLSKQAETGAAGVRCILGQ